VCGHRGGRGAEPVPAPGLETAPSGQPAWIYAPALTSACTRMDGARNRAKASRRSMCRASTTPKSSKRPTRGAPHGPGRPVAVRIDGHAALRTAAARSSARIPRSAIQASPVSSRRSTSSWQQSRTRSRSAPRRSGRPEASRCTSHAGPHAHSQYRMNRARVIRNDRGPVGCTRNTASGPAGPSPPNVGWMQLKLCHASLCPWRDPGPSP
jgi:hypothetical protein